MPPGSLPLPGLEYRSIPLLPHPTAQSRPAGRAAPPAAATRLASELRPGSAALRPNSPRAASRGLHAPLGRTGQSPSTLMSPTNFGTAAPVHSTAQGAGAAGVHDAPALASSSSPALATGPPASPKASSRGRLNSARGGLAGASTIATSRLLGTGDDDGAKLSARDAEAPAPAAHAPHLWALGLEPGAEPAPAPPAEPTPRTVPGLSVTQGANGGAGADGGAAAAHACNGGCNGISSEGHDSRVASARPSTPSESKLPAERSAGAPAATVTPGRPETSRNDSSAESADDVIVIHVRDDNRCAAAPLTRSRASEADLRGAAEPCGCVKRPTPPRLRRRRINRDFYCSRDLLLRHMSYFQNYLSGERKYVDTAIPAHRDVTAQTCADDHRDSH